MMRAAATGRWPETGPRSDRRRQQFLRSEIHEKGKTAAEALAYMKEHGVTLRGLAGYRMPNHLRISVGAVAGNDAALKHLADFLGK
jgi:histidinol-phosphate/aromatic aminotransferase/cobyric acid decarboxylase-like protein